MLLYRSQVHIYYSMQEELSERPEATNPSVLPMRQQAEHSEQSLVH